MTVRDTVAALKFAERIHIAWNQRMIDIDPRDSIMLKAFGDYKVDYIYAYKPDGEGSMAEYEIGLAVQPIKEETA